MVDDSCSNGITQNVERSQEGIQEPVHTKENANLKDSTSIIYKFVMIQGAQLSHHVKENQLRNLI